MSCGADAPRCDSAGVPPTTTRALVITGLSGAGKSTAVARLLESPHFLRAITATTRAPRGAERDGIDYEFLDEASFRRRVAHGEFLEHAEVYGSLYGTPRKNVRAILDSGRHCVIVVDVQGSRSLRALLEEALYVFIDAPDMQELERRLRGRGQDSHAAIQRRLATAVQEKASCDPRDFDLWLENEDIERTAARLAAIVGLELPPRRRVSEEGRS